MTDSNPFTTSADALITKVTATGVSRSDAVSLVGQWLLGSVQAGGRSFAFSAPLPAADATWQATFARSFQHADWIDGESVVQAGQSVGEDGFNTRLHRIEADLDALGQQARTTYANLNALRQAVVTMLEEVRLELNRIDADLSPRTGGGVQQSGIDKYLLGPKFSGSAVIAGQKVQMWQTDQGVLALPWVAGAGGPDPLVNPDGVRAPQLAGLIATHPELVADITAGRTTSQLVAAHGNLRAEDGTSFADLVSTVPADGTFATTGDLVTLVTQQDVVATVALGSQEAVSSRALGGARVSTDTAAVPLDSVATLSSQERFALAGAGITTVGQLTAAGPEQVQGIFDTAGTGAVPGRAAVLDAGFKVAAGLQGLVRARL